ncbi:NACHT domain-containing NTPase [Microcoleus sp. FACHB-831]|uniref:NACHT domain-containing protein n=1 Tax=Microcoleus sp. FACHB-831 TaxID=2692827 RepID=UPI001F556C14|nr:NACHT domain-containing NTPase [Microcoleus sp. FACHB-831]
MASHSVRASKLRASKQGIKKAYEALNHKGWIKKDLKKEAGLSYQPVSRFFNGWPVSRYTVDKIYTALGLRHEDGDIEPNLDEQAQDNSTDIDTLVQQVRSLRRAKIQEQCGKMRMLDIERAIATAEIYTDVNVLEKITSLQWLEISDLLQGFNPESDDFDRQGLGRVQKRVPGKDAVERYSKLMVLGKPGAGKTTFLQWIAVQCDNGEFQSRLIPIFIRLKNFAKDTKGEFNFNLFNYIKNEFRTCGLADETVIETVLTQGRALILLDGLDEVSEADDDVVVDQIIKFCETYFQNQFIITCRIAAGKYRFVDENFTEVEVADFKPEQVEAFAKKWFVAVAQNNPVEGEATAKRFIDKLNLPQNNRIRNLAVTPILLNLTCFVFQEKGEFPSKRSTLYEEGLEILLVRWDEERKIERDEVYNNLSLPRKIKLLIHVAAITFEQGYYFFEQSEVKRLIANYLCTLPDAKTDSSQLELDSDAVLRAIEAQHGLLVERAKGIYSFSHLTFQEYFTAKHFVDSSGSQALENLANHITESRWREVFLLTAEMMPNAKR